jgi:DNA-directed RNA polymerase beta' subunit
MKKLLSGITTMVLVLGLFTTGVQAKGNTYEQKMSYEQVVQMVEQTDKEIYALIDAADYEADELVRSYKGDNLSYEQFNNQIERIINDLISTTNKKVEETIREAGKSQFIVEPEWIKVKIGDRFVLIDPCRVVGF